MELRNLGIEIKNCANDKTIYIDSRTAMKIFSKEILNALDFDTESILPS